MFWVTLFVFLANLSGVAAAGNLYTIHCASYKTSEQAVTDVKKMAAIGYPAFIMQVEIKEKGKWYRVYTGKYETKQKARLAAEEMVKKKVLSEYSIFPVSADKAAKNKDKNTIKEDSSTGKSTVIIANSDSKRYHLPGMPFYNKVKKHHRVVFNSESEAINAGYYKSGNTNIQMAKDKQAAVPVTEKHLEKSSSAQLKQEMQSRQANVKKEPIDAKAKTVEKIRPVPPARVLEKNTGKTKKN